MRGEVEISSKALEVYKKRMDSIGLSQDYINKIKEGKLEIEDINNEDTYKRLKNIKNGMKNTSMFSIRPLSFMKN